MTSLLARVAVGLVGRVPGGVRGRVVVAQAAGLVGAALGALIGERQVFAHPGVTGTTPGEVPVVLSDRDEEVRDSRASLWPGGQVALLWRRRRIDTLYDDAGRAVRLIVVGDGEAVGEVLRGAARVRERWRPAVLVDLRAMEVGARRAVLRAAAAGPLKEVAAGMFASEAVDMGALPEDVATGEVSFDDRLECGGLHPPEYDAPAGGRWTGASYATWFDLPRPVAGVWRLRLAVADWGSVAATLTVMVEGEMAAEDGRGLGWVRFGSLPIGARGDVVRVRLLLPRPVADLVRWPRMIGMRIVSAEWEPA